MFLEFAFAFMVVAGVVGEYAASSRIAYNAGRLQRIADEQLDATEQRAVDATNLAGNIGDRADKLGTLLTHQEELLNQQRKLLDVERETSARFQKQATSAELALASQQKRRDDNIRRRGARATLLLDTHIGNDPRLAEFAGQNLYVFNCEPHGDPNPLVQRDLEVLDTTYALNGQLNQFAHWNLLGGQEQCGSAAGLFFGIGIFTSPRASERSRRAATTLGQVVREALLTPSSRDPPLLTSNNEDPIVTVAEFPTTFRLKNPDTVVVRVDKHPIF